MGRPAFFRGDTPGDLDTEGTKIPPIKDTPPRRRSINSRVNNHADTPEGRGLALSPLFTHQDMNRDRQTYTIRLTQVPTNSHDTPRINADCHTGPTKNAQERLPGGAARRRPDPITPPK